MLGAFVTADYFAVFSVKQEVKLDFVEARFRTIDQDTKALVFEVGVRCFQKNNMNACTRRESHQAGVVSAHIPIYRVVERTLLFKKSEEIIKSADPKLQVMLLHKDYHNPVKTIVLEDIYTKREIEYTVEMPPRDWGEYTTGLENTDE